MNAPGQSTGALAGLRVLDLTGATGAFAAKLLAQFGAGVLKVEPPGGAPTRRYQPSTEDGTSLWFAYYHANERSIALDLTTPDGQQTLRDLATRSDILLEDGRPGELASLGLGYDDLLAINPALIYASVTGFGQTGPRSGWRWTDLIAGAASGVTYISGLPDREPITSAGQTTHFAGFYAVHGILIALHEREKSGRGQHIDISAQEAMLAHQETLIHPYNFAGEIPRRLGSEYGLLVPYIVLPCQDGYILVISLSQGQWQSTIEWLSEAGAVEDLADEKWADPLVRLAYRQHVHDVFARFVANRTKDELFHEAQRRSIPFAKVSTVEDLAADPHLAARDTFREADWTGSGKPVRAPGPVVRLSRGGAKFRHAAPRLNEHAEEIRAILHEDVRRPNGAAAGASESNGPPLAGVKIADFTWVGAGPLGTRILGDFGATVVKIEAHSGDVLRGIGPYKDGIRTDNSSGMFNCFNRNKLSLRLDLKHPDGLALAREMVRWADVVPANFSAGMMARFGLGYEDLLAINPCLIMVEMPGFGTYGPFQDYVSYAPTLQAYSGVTNLTGYPDAGPTGIGHGFSDHVGGLSMALAILLGLRHRERTGEGQWIEIAQLEASIAMLGPAVLDYFATGRVRGPVANEPVEFPRGPSGIFRCAGDDRWVAIDVTTDDEWRSFCQAVERPELAERAEFATGEDRARNAATLASLVTGWTAQRDSWEAAEILQRAGIAAGPVEDARDLVERDSHLRERGFWVTVDHPELGPLVIDRSPVRLSRTPGSVRRAAPLIGQDTENVLHDHLGWSQERSDSLLVEGVI